MTTTPFPIPVMDDDVDIRDFTIREKRVRFRIDGDVFEAQALLGIPLMQELVKSTKAIGKMVEEERYEGIFAIFDQLLYPDSAQRFRERATSVGDEAIDVRRQLIPVLYYLLEKYGLRPTQQSSDSSTGSPSGTDGTTTTAGVSVAVLG